MRKPIAPDSPMDNVRKAIEKIRPQAYCATRGCLQVNAHSGLHTPERARLVRDTLERFARQDEIAQACIKLQDAHGTSTEEIAALALEELFKSRVELKRNLAWYMERYQGMNQPPAKP